MHCVFTVYRMMVDILCCMHKALALMECSVEYYASCVQHVIVTRIRVKCYMHCTMYTCTMYVHVCVQMVYVYVCSHSFKQCCEGVY